MVGEEERRADPDALLATLHNEGRGRLTVFLGAAAGVGKTYAMLQAAKERIAEGTEVVIGWVESHGRVETEALLPGLPVIPPRIVQYQGRTFKEMDLDAILARRPRVALVDELAHTNIPGSRHARRYQDVEELLAAGISVFTALNVQHVESLNDVVARITGIIVRETVPDKVLEGAEIKLVDIPSEELLQRLKEGKVYVPDQARDALRKFFRLGNIGALRELALRYAAQRVDSDLETYMRAHAIPGPWPTAERVMACISQSPLSTQLIRSAYRQAANLKAEWLVIYVETPRRLTVSEAERDQLSRNLRLAEEMGAEIVTIAGDDVADEVLRVARQRNVTHIIIGKPIYSGFRQWVHGAVVDKIIRHSEGISVHVISAKTHPPQNTVWTYSAPRAVRLAPLVGVAVMVAVVSLIGRMVEPYLGITNLALAYLLPVMASAVAWGTPWAATAAAAGILAFDFLFVPPVLHLTVANGQYFFTFAMYLAVAWLTGTVAGRLRQHIDNTRSRERRTAALYSLSRNIAAIVDLKTVLATAARKTAESIDGDVVVLSPDGDGKLDVQASAGSRQREMKNGVLSRNELAVATWVFEHGQVAGHGTGTLEGASGLYFPLRTEAGVIGVLGVWPNSEERWLLPDQRRLLEAFASLIAIACTRVKLAEHARQADLAAESERLWMALFNSLSHDLRTPLSSIIGAVTGLLEGDGLYTQSARRELLQTIKQGAVRMNRLVGNLFDMARVSSGTLKLDKDWCDIQDIIGVAVGRFSDNLAFRPVDIDVEPGLPLVAADLVLIEQVLVNLLDNALKYSEPGTEIRISAHRQQGEVKVGVSDKGHGIPQDELTRIFDEFYRVKTTRQASGTGLGLAICKAFVEAHGGRIWAESNPGVGTEITFTLPLGDELPGKVPVTSEGDHRGH